MNIYMKIETKNDLFSLRLAKAKLPLFFGIRKKRSGGARTVAVHLFFITVMLTRKPKHKKICECVRKIKESREHQKKIVEP